MFTKPDSAFIARVAGVEFVGRTFNYQPGYYVTGVEGLLMGGSVGYEQIASGTGDGHGELDMPNVRTDPRIITLTGFAYGRSMWELGQLLMRLSGILARRSDKGDFVWEEFGQTFRTEVRRGQDTPARRRGTTGFADFTIRFRAPSQRFFGPAGAPVGPAASITLTNRGNYSMFPIVEVTGSMPAGYTLIAGPGRYIVTQALASGQTHRIDMIDRVLYLDGTAQTGGVSRADALGVPPSTSRAFSIEPVSGSGQIKATPVDTYI